MQRDRLLVVLRLVASGSCPHCARNASRVLEGVDASTFGAWSVATHASGCSWLQREVREEVKAALRT